MIRAVLRFATWTIGPDTAEGAPTDPLYEMECTTCGVRSPASETSDDVQDWALGHSGRNLTHTGYRGIGTSFWRTSMVDDGPRLPGQAS
ncbi:hypothetical protein [Streptomyces sp.]|uniref:DUF7848 domain-containing protein n=1 Tax=Streptomyces sp. TaxID=1931 RepID=UPI002F3FC3B0